MCPTWIKYKKGINAQNMVIKHEWEQSKSKNNQTKLPPSTITSQPAPTFSTTDTTSDPTPAPTFAQAVSTLSKPAPAQITPPMLDLPSGVQSLDLSSRSNRIMQVNEVAAILKFLLRPANLAAIQAIDENKRDDYTD